MNLTNFDLKNLTEEDKNLLIEHIDALISRMNYVENRLKEITLTMEAKDLWREDPWNS